LIAGGAGAVAALVLGASTTRAQETMSETQSTGPEGLLTSLHQEVELKSSLIESMTFFWIPSNSPLFPAEPAKISRAVGGPFSVFGGKIEGRNIELVPDKRIVQCLAPRQLGSGRVFDCQI